MKWFKWSWVLCLGAVTSVFAGDLFWEGTNGTWSVGGGGWKLADGTPTVFQEGDNVTFGEAEEAVEVTVEGNFEVGNLLIEASNDYTFKPVKRTAKLAELNGCITEAVSFVKRGSGILYFSNFGGTWTCDMHIAEGQLFCKNGSGGGTVFIALAPQNTFFGDLSVERQVIIGSGDPENVASLRSEDNLHNPTGNANTELVATFVFDAGNVVGSRSVIFYPKLILKNGAVIQASPTMWGNAVNYWTGDVWVARREDDQPAAGVSLTYIGYGSHLPERPDDPIVFRVDDVTAPSSNEVDNVIDFTVGWAFNENGTTNIAEGFIKSGNGIMKLSYGSSKFRGDVVIDGGVLQVNANALGIISSIPRTISVNSGATLEYLARNALVGEGDTKEPLLTTILSNATLKVGLHNCLGKIKVLGNSVINPGTGYPGRGLFRFGSESYFETDDTLKISSGDNIRIGYEKDTIRIPVGDPEAGVENCYGKVELCVQPAKVHTTHFADLVLDLPVWDVYANGGDSWNQKSTRFSGILKTGPGVLALTKTNRYKYITDVAEGGLWLSGSVVSNVVVRPGAFVNGTGTVNANLEIEEGGGFWVDATNTTAQLTVNSQLVLPTAGLVKLYHVEETDVTQVKYTNLPLPTAAEVIGLDTLQPDEWKVEIDGFTPSETRHLCVTFDVDQGTYSIGHRVPGTRLIIR